ncbi:MAG: MBL fold metallo-hydrolase [Bacteroidales bacterium]
MTILEKDLNELIVGAIEASLSFESYMDAIDFNSYLQEEQETTSIKETQDYRDYLEMINNCALKGYVDLVHNNIPGRIKKIPFNPNQKDHYEMAWFLVSNLFKAKKIRLAGRQIACRKKEEREYIKGCHLLNFSFNHIQGGKFVTYRKNLLKDYNWAKVLYYNELAICYSGLAKSSMSLGYAEESVSLLENLYPELRGVENFKKEEETDGIKKLEAKYIEQDSPLTFSRIHQLYTFALYNKGEAERLLSKLDSSKESFQRISNIYENISDANLSDCCSALLHEASILIDQGRGQEAIKLLKSSNFSKLKTPDCRIQIRDLEMASAFIDQKEYKHAWNLLKDYISNSRWYKTFPQRQAKTRLLHILNEYRENRPENFQISEKLSNFSDWEKLNEFKEIKYDKIAKTITITLILTEVDKNKVTDLMSEEDKFKIESLWRYLKYEDAVPVEMKNEYPNFENVAKDLIRQSCERKDGDSFKETCTKFARFYQDRNKMSDKAIKYFFLYLLEKKLFTEKIDINDWLNDSDHNTLIQSNNDLFKKELSIKREDEEYLKNFFHEYIKDREEKSTLILDKIIAKRLKERLVDIYSQKSKYIELEQVVIKYELFLQKLKGTSLLKVKGKAAGFIKDAFFRNLQEGLHINSIAKQMKTNTTSFITNVIGKSNLNAFETNEERGNLCILRRWNSFTPALSSSINQSKGGGYFLRFSQNNRSFGIVIDPGYDFLDNFFSQGFKIGDINLILVSHAHPDHTDNLASILSLFHEMNGRLGEYPKNIRVNKKNPTLILSSGVFEHYGQIISSSEKDLKDIIVFDRKDNIIEKVYKDDSGICEIQAFGTAHQDLSHSQSLGFKIIVKQTDRTAVIGYTGDVKWKLKNNSAPEYINYFTDCNIIIAHIGSIINTLKHKNFCSTFCSEFPKNNSVCENLEKCYQEKYINASITKSKLIEQTQNENHLYLAGLTLFFNSILENKENKLKLAIISEFGEELKNGIRMDLYLKFNEWFNKHNNNQVCLPGDIGLDVDVFTGNVFCHCCKRFVDRIIIKPVPYGKEEAICFVCKECETVLSPYQIDQMLKEYCENGRQLETVDSNSYK